MTKVFEYHPTNIISFEQKVFYWSAQFDTVTYLNSNNHLHEFSYSSFNAMIGVGIHKEVANNFSSLKKFCDNNNEFLCGFLSYELKNQFESLTSTNKQNISIPDLYFFVPKLLFKFNNICTIEYHEPYSLQLIKEIITDIENFCIEDAPVKPVQYKTRISKNDYIKKIESIKKHIFRGNIYEINLCHEFYAENIQINPYAVYGALNKISPMPFSCFFRYGNTYLLSASPERFIKKSANTIISQPIKGTIRRGENSEHDNHLIHQLKNDKKERAENTMIVDLVRNDLAKTALKGSVKVEELYGIYTYNQVHQMISTISSQHNPQHHFLDIIRHAFPMGSMTGAPKIKAMQYIDKYENTQRGLYSGAVGYITPNNDFDFNVVIRSIIYDASKKYVSFHVGSAITAQSDAEKEYEECLLKAQAIFKVLQG